VELIEQTDTDYLGTNKYTQVRFRNGDRWNLLMFSKKDTDEIKAVLKRHARKLGRAKSIGALLA
jgi:hypothetical protein